MNQMFGDPFSQQQTQPLEQATPGQNTFGQVMGPVSPSTSPQGGGLSELLQNLGIDHTNIARNELGRVQLLGRLKAKYGQGIENNADATNALSMFDKEIGQYKMDSQNDLTRMASSGKNTLSALFG